MASPKDELQTIIDSEIKNGYFSAAFVESGYLDQAAPVISQFYSADKSAGDVFDLASLTKALATGPLVYQILQRKKLPYLSSLGAWAAAEPRLESRFLQLRTDKVLGHQAGLPAWRNFWMNHLETGLLNNRQAIQQHICESFHRIPIEASPSNLYSDVGYILLGLLIEQTLGQTLDLAFADLLTQLDCKEPSPIGFSTQLRLEKNRYVPTAFCAVRDRLLQGEVHDENCAALGGVAGHAGLFASGEGLSRFLKALYSDKFYRGYFAANELQRIQSDSDGLLGMRRGNGTSAQLFGAGQAMGHLGFTGTAFWLLDQSGRYGIFLSNRTLSGRVSPRMTEVRRQVFQVLDNSFE